MALSSSLYASISGLSTMGEAMSVLGDNISNVNTISFKSSRSTFQDVLSQTVSTAAGSAQVGRGVTLSTVAGLFAQGSFESTSSPTDLAIGGQGFFMLRAKESNSADMYTRAGEFGFDMEGNLINPIGHYVQGWGISPDSNEVSGTIGDIYLGKTTPPVATQQIEVIVNLDSREANETNEIRLYDAWDGRNAGDIVPSPPISPINYEYTSAIKIYDSKGASHDLTVYFDRTTDDNEWEFLVTCDPSEDLRNLTAKEQIIYSPYDNYNLAEHKGAGALMYGVLKFNTSGDIDNVIAWDVPPDGKVDPALSINRLVLETGDSYYSFPSNFTGSLTDQMIKVNLGARYSGAPTNQSQILVSSKGAYSDPNLSNAITKETLWKNVYDSAGNAMTDGDVFYYSGYKNDGNAVSGSYIVHGDDKVSKFLTDGLKATFDCTATIDAEGKLKLTDNTGGESGMFVTGFTLSSATGSDPFGGGSTILNNMAITETAGAHNNVGTIINSPTALLTTIAAIGGPNISAGPPGDTFVFTGTAIDGTGLGAGITFTVGVDGTTIQHLLDFMEDVYANGVLDGVPSNWTRSPNIVTNLDAGGKIRIADLTHSGRFGDIDCRFNGAAAVNPFGILNGNNILRPLETATGRIDITSTKRQVVSPGRGLVTSNGLPPTMEAATNWDSVYDAAGTAVVTGDTMIFTGTRGDGSTASVTYIVNTTDGSDVQDLLDALEEGFSADATIDGAGRLILRDRIADTSTQLSSLGVQSVSYAPLGAANLFGPPATPFDAVVGDLAEDGSLEGDVISSSFESEALASTQYANGSTTIFQDQNGFSSGFLQSVAVDTEGTITGHYSNGQVLQKARVALASFNNLGGLDKKGGNIFTETSESGAPVTGAPGSNGLGSIAPNALEQSNVDLGTEFVKLITVQRGFQASSKIITVTDDMLNDLINIKR